MVSKPETIDPKPEQSQDYQNPLRLDRFAEAIINPIGEKVTAKVVMNEVPKARIYYEESGGGVTFSRCFSTINITGQIEKN